MVPRNSTSHLFPAAYDLLHVARFLLPFTCQLLATNYYLFTSYALPTHTRNLPPISSCRLYTICYILRYRRCSFLVA